MGKNLENAASWGTDRAGHEIAFVAGPQDIQGMSPTEVMNSAVELERRSGGLRGGVADAMRRRASNLLDLAIQQEVAQQGEGFRKSI